MTGRTRDQQPEIQPAAVESEHTCESSWCLKDGLDPGYCLGDIGVVPATADPSTYGTTGDELRVRYADVTVSRTVRLAGEEEHDVPTHVGLAVGANRDQMIKLTTAEARQLAAHLVAGALEVENDGADQ